eukprot:6016092-Alexandrium_andersonii.AAC.1
MCNRQATRARAARAARPTRRGCNAARPTCEQREAPAYCAQQGTQTTKTTRAPARTAARPHNARSDSCCDP